MPARPIRQLQVRLTWISFAQRRVDSTVTPWIGWSRSWPADRVPYELTMLRRYRKHGMLTAHPCGGTGRESFLLCRVAPTGATAPWLGWTIRTEIDGHV